MRDVFPRFCRLLETSGDFALIVDPTAPDPDEQIYFAGLDGRLGIPELNEDSEAMDWNVLLPPTLDRIRHFEITSGARLSPQLRQMFVRANGLLGEGRSAYFFPLQELDHLRLYAVYAHIREEDPANVADIDTERWGRMRAFLEVFDAFNADSIGLFVDEPRGDAEHASYLWNHETRQFEDWAPDFATALDRALTPR